MGLHGADGSLRGTFIIIHGALIFVLQTTFHTPVAPVVPPQAPVALVVPPQAPVVPPQAPLLVTMQKKFSILYKATFNQMSSQRLGHTGVRVKKVLQNNKLLCFLTL